MTAPAVRRRPQPGDVWESRDRREAGRRVRLVSADPPDACNPLWLCETVTRAEGAYRPPCATRLREATLTKHWRLATPTDTTSEED